MLLKFIKHYVRRVRRLRAEIAQLEAKRALAAAIHEYAAMHPGVTGTGAFWLKEEIKHLIFERDQWKRDAATYYSAWQAAKKG